MKCPTCKRKVKASRLLNTYRIYGNDLDDYAFGGPLFDKRQLSDVKAKSPVEAVQKFYRKSRKNHWGWRLYELSARKIKEKHQ